MAYAREGRHSRAPAWARAQKLEGKYFGVELEIHHARGYQRLLKLLPETDNPLERPCCEMDGSLDMHNGLEIVFPPIKYDTIRAPDSFFAKSLAALRDGGASVPKNLDWRGDIYGMHINVNSADWTPIQRQRFCALLNWCPDSWIIAIGGRKLGMYCARQHHWEMRGYILGGMGAGNRGMTAIRSGGSRIEVRFPIATTDHHKVVMLTHFLEVIEDLAKLVATTRALNKMWRRDDYLNIDKTHVEVGEYIAKHLDTYNTDWSRELMRILTNGYEEQANQEALEPAVAQAA